MALLDVSFVLDDPLFCDQLTCIRIGQTVNKYGRAEETRETLPFFGVVTDGSGALVARNEDAERMPETLTVHTRFRLRGVQEGAQPDEVHFGGGRYEVTAIHNWSHFGAGFVCAELHSLTMPDGRE